MQIRNGSISKGKKAQRKKKASSIHVIETTCSTTTAEHRSVSGEMWAKGPGRKLQSGENVPHSNTVACNENHFPNFPVISNACIRIITTQWTTSASSITKQHQVSVGRTKAHSSGAEVIFNVYFCFFLLHPLAWQCCLSESWYWSFHTSVFFTNNIVLKETGSRFPLSYPTL